MRLKKGDTVKCIDTFGSSVTIGKIYKCTYSDEKKVLLTTRVQRWEQNHPEFDRIFKIVWNSINPNFSNYTKKEREICDM